MVNTIFVIILIVFYHILKCMIIIFNITYYFLLILLCFYWDGVPVKVFESIWKSIWNTFEKYLHLQKIKVFAFAFEKFVSVFAFLSYVIASCSNEKFIRLNPTQNRLECASKQKKLVKYHNKLVSEASFVFNYLLWLL